MSRADAQALAAQGWRVFPTREKRPLTPNGFHDATADPPADWPDDAQVAIALPQGMLVVDVDEQAGLDALERAHGPLPPTLTALSGKRGEHRYYRHAANGTLTQRKLAPGVDTRIGGKGYVVAPPSVHHETGRAYAWQEPALPIADAPAWLVAALAPVESPTISPSGGIGRDRNGDHIAQARAYLATVPPALEGRDSDGKGTTGGTHTFAVCVKVVRGFNLTDHAAMAALEDWNARCEPPWDEHGLRRKVREAAEKGEMPWGGMIPDTELASAIRAGATATAATQTVAFDADDIFAPLPPVDYLVHGIGLVAGPPAMIAGFGFSGKTAAAQQLAIDLAREDHAGEWMNPRPVWGRFLAPRRARVLHLDWEQGQNLSRRRYQRLAKAAGIEPASLRGYLRLVPFPTWYTNTAPGYAQLEKMIDGFDLVIVDSFRAANPGTDENASDAREPLDAMARLSEKHGCAFLVIHHARKPNKDRIGGAVMAVRGSGAITDATSSLLVFSSEEKDAPKLVHHEREKNSGTPLDDFTLVIEDHEGGFRVRAQDLVVKTAAERSQAEMATDVEKIRAWLQTNLFFKNRDQIARAVGISNAAASAAMGAMQSGPTPELVCDGSYHNRSYHLSGQKPRE